MGSGDAILSRRYRLRHGANSGDTILNLSPTSTTTQIETGGSPATLTTAYEYDSAGRRTKITYPGSFDITYDWSPTGLNAINQGASTALIAFGYDDRGRRTSLTRETGASDLTTTYDYDPLSRLEEFELSNANGAYNLTRTFTRNQAGQITGRTSDISAFDAASPMTGTEAYDVNGLNQVTEQGAAVFDFDAFGNQAERDPDTGASNDEETWAFDVLNRLIEHQSAPAAAETALVYDALGRLARTTKGSSDYQFVYDGVDLIAEYDGSGGLIRRYVHGPGMDEPLVWYEGSGTANRSYLFADERGSIIGRIDDDGDVMATRTYNEYGAPYDVSVQTGEEPGRFGFTGQAWIGDIGAAYYKARFYSPNLGRFLSPDPIGYGDGPNMYAYVGNDPVNFVDPFGLQGEAGTTVSGVLVPNCRGGRIYNSETGQCIQPFSPPDPIRVAWSLIGRIFTTPNSNGFGTPAGRPTGPEEEGIQPLTERPYCSDIVDPNSYTRYTIGYSVIGGIAFFGATASRELVVDIPNDVRGIRLGNQSSRGALDGLGAILSMGPTISRAEGVNSSTGRTESSDYRFVAEVAPIGGGLNAPATQNRLRSSCHINGPIEGGSFPVERGSLGVGAFAGCGEVSSRTRMSAPLLCTEQ